MNTIIKTVIAAGGLIAAVLVPLTADADTTIFSGKGSSASVSGSNGTLSLYASAFANTTQSKSNKTNSSGASLSGTNYTGSQCWYGYGSTDTIEFRATGPLPKRVTASGSVLVTWYEFCSLFTSITETVTFNIDASAMTDQVYQNRTTSQYEFGNTKVNSNYDYSFAPASGAASSISSPTFGTVIPNSGSVGQSRQHNVQIIR